MSVQKRDNRYVVRWRADGRHHARSFQNRAEAVRFDRGLRNNDNRVIDAAIDNLDEAGLRRAAARIQARLEATT